MAMHCSTLLLKWIWRLVQGDCRPEADADETVIGEKDAIPGDAGLEKATESERPLLPKIGRSRSRFSGCWARRESVACFIRVDEDSDRWSMISDKLRFFKMGFLELNELLLESWLAGGAESKSRGLAVPV